MSQRAAFFEAIDAIDGEWELYIPRERVAPLFADRRFRRILTLGRVANVLRYAIAALVPLRGDRSPAARLQRFNSFFLHGAMLVEGMDLARRLAQDFRSDPAFQEGFGKLLRDPDVAKLVKRHLKGLRNEAVFHADDDLAGPTGGESQVDFVFMTGIGLKRGDLHYEASDLGTARVMLGTLSEGEDYRPILRAAMKQTTALTKAFLSAADRLMLAYVQQEQLQVRPARPRQEAAQPTP